MKAARKNLIEGQCRIIEKGMAQGNSRKAYQILKTITKNKSTQDLSHQWPLKLPSHLKYCCTEHRKDLYNFHLKTDTNILQNNQTRTSRSISPRGRGWKNNRYLEGRKVTWCWQCLSSAAQTGQEWDNKGPRCFVPKSLVMKRITQRMDAVTSHTHSRIGNNNSARGTGQWA